MMKFREMSTERKAAVAIGNVLFFGGLIVGLAVPGFFNRALLAGIEAAGIAIELLAYCGFGRKAV